jgi:hypothetical protein
MQDSVRREETVRAQDNPDAADTAAAEANAERAGDVAPMENLSDVDGQPVDVEAVEIEALDIEPVAPDRLPVMWDESTVGDLRIRWDAIQMRFVDDPGTSAAAAKALVGEAIEALKTSLARHEQELAAGDPATEDTEVLRQLVSRYRKIFESVVRP